MFHRHLKKGDYMRKNIFISFLTSLIFFIFLNILFINEYKSFLQIIIFFSFIMFLESLATRKLSWKIINFEKKYISNNIVKVLYYIFILMTILFVSVILYAYNTMYLLTNIFSFGLWAAIKSVTISFWIILTMFVPYIQALIMLLINKLEKNSKNKAH